MVTTGALLLFVLLVVSGCATGGPWICSDYGSVMSCTGGRYIIPSLGIYSHQGIDFAGAAGTEVISATHGVVTAKRYDSCSGHSITVKTDLVGRGGDLEGPLYAKYFHAEALPTLESGQDVKPGDVIGRIIPLLGTECYRTREHVHYELRVFDIFGKHVNPHDFWVGGKGKVTCFKPGLVVPPGKTVAPVRC